MPTPLPETDAIVQYLESDRAAERLREIGERFGCVIHIARVIGKKRWSYVAGDTGGDMLSCPGQRLSLDHEFGAILYPRRPVDADWTRRIAAQLNTLLETIDIS